VTNVDRFLHAAQRRGTTVHMLSAGFSQPPHRNDSLKALEGVSGDRTGSHWQLLHSPDFNPFKLIYMVL
jgi:hypothetical protein